MSRINKQKIQDAIETPFDNSINGYASDNVQEAIEEASSGAALESRSPLLFWEFNTNSNTYMYLAGQTKSNLVPYVVPKSAFLREAAVTARITNTPASAFYGIFRTTSIINPTIGSVSTVTNQGLTWSESDFPYLGTTRITINLVNNGPNLPLVFSENTILRTVTVQLATNSGGLITTTATQLRDAFRNNSSITQIWRITGSGGSPLTTASFTTSGGSVGDAIGSIFIRGSGVRTREYNVPVSPLDLISVQSITIDIGNIAETSIQVTFNFS